MGVARPVAQLRSRIGCSFSASAPRDPVSFQTSGSVSHFCKPCLRRLQDFPAFPSCFFIACMILPKLDKSIHFFSPSVAMDFYFAGGPLLICHSTQPTDGQSVVKGVKSMFRSRRQGFSAFLFRRWLCCHTSNTTHSTLLREGTRVSHCFWKWFKGFCLIITCIRYELSTEIAKKASY